MIHFGGGEHDESVLAGVALDGAVRGDRVGRVLHEHVYRSERADYDLHDVLLGKQLHDDVLLSGTA